RKGKVVEDLSWLRIHLSQVDKKLPTLPRLRFFNDLLIVREHAPGWRETVHRGDCRPGGPRRRRKAWSAMPWSRRAGQAVRRCRAERFPGRALRYRGSRR